MSEWYENGPHDNRHYGATVHAVAAVAGGWQLRDGTALVWAGREGLPFARAVCDEHAVAYALVLLAKRLAAWAESIDARLAREYRAAHREMRERGAELERTGAGTPAGDVAYDNHRRAMHAFSAAANAIARGYP